MEKDFKYSKSEKRGLKQLKPTMSNILSVGISTGGSAEICMAKRCPNAQIIATSIDKNGIAFSKEKISKFKESKRIEIKLENVSKPMPYEDKTFDFIYARLILHYLTKQELDKALTELYRVLKPNGKLFIVARNNLEWEISNKEYVVEYNEETNMTTYYPQWQIGNTATRQFLSESQLKEVLISHNFKVKSLKSYKEKLYTDYERTKKNRSKKANSLTEVIAIKQR